MSEPIPYCYLLRYRYPTDYFALNSLVFTNLLQCHIQYLLCESRRSGARKTNQDSLCLGYYGSDDHQQHTDKL